MPKESWPSQARREGRTKWESILDSDLDRAFLAQNVDGESLVVAGDEQIHISIIDGETLNSQFVEKRRKMGIIELNEPL